MSPKEERKREPEVRESPEQFEEDLHDAAIRHGIPGYMIEGLTKYLEEHRPTGGFLKSILSNDLHTAVLVADSMNRQLLANYVMFLRERAPAGAWGSKEKYDAWVKKGSIQTNYPERM